MSKTSDQSFDASFARCADQLRWALRQLGLSIDEDTIASTAELIIQTMTGAWRFFHTPEHIFDVGRSGDAIEVLAALFHDAIHIQADNGVSVNVGQIVSPFIRESNKSLRILDSDKLPYDPVFDLVSAVFGFRPGQVLQSMRGQNEFLSAVVAAKSLGPTLPLGVAAQIAACIEATIPFRTRTGTSDQPALQLRQRLETINKRFKIGWDEATLDHAVQRAIRLANRDVENFAHEATAEFLNNTWNLMPETNHDLLGAYAYTVSGYRKSLQKMEGFMAGLTPEAVFQQYRDEPTDAAFAIMLKRTRHNLEVARLYLGSKMLSIAIVEAVSQRLGNEVPLATMMGELPQRGTPDAQMESFLPPVTHPVKPQGALQTQVLQLLEVGRSAESSYDVKHSPVATFVIKSVGFTRALELLEVAREYFLGRINGEEFLKRCDAPIVEAIVTSVYSVFEIRLQAIRGVRAHV